jgi:hypothetical protein
MPPIVVTGPSVLIGDLQFNGAGGGWFSGQAPLGGTFVVGANGNVIVGDGYGGNSASGVFQITPAGVQTVLANFTNSNAAGMDQYGNVYIARDYGDSIIKIPYDSATGQYVGFTTLPTANCLGATQDSAACIFAPGTKAVIDAGATAGGGNAGFNSLLFDGQGNFFFATDTNPGTSPGNANTIYECSAKCQAETDGSGTYPPVVVYADKNTLGVVSVDPWGNLFFSDGQGNSKGNNTYVEELPLSNGKYASSPTAIATYTSSASYNAISGVVANKSAIYFAIPNDGVYAIPNSSSGPNAAGIYKVSNEGGKGMTLDSTGNVYVVNYSNSLSHDGVFMTLMGNIGFGASPVGTATAGKAVTVIDMAANCTTAPTLSFNASSEYGITPPASGSCSTAANTSQGTISPALASNGASFSASIAFTPAQAGPRYSDLIITDSTNSASGMTALNGVGQAPMANLDPGASTAFTTGLTSPASVVADAAGDVFIADSGAGKVFEIVKGTPTAIGSGFMTPSALAFDANGDLFIADDGLFEVEEIPNTGTTGAFVAGTQTTVVATTDLFGELALGSATGLAIGPQDTLYISDPANKRVVYYNLITGQAGVTLAFEGYGISSPMGLAVDSSNDLFVADSALNEVLEFSPAAGISTITPPKVTQAIGVAVDGSGSLLVADGLTGNIFRIPNESGTLTLADTITVESLGSAVSSLWLDSMGDAYVASASGQTAYAIQRTAASVNLGTVSDGLTNSQTVYLENAGNQTATLATPSVTEPTNSMFMLEPAATNGCSNGGSGPAGSACQLTATFAPATGTADGIQTGTGYVNVATPAVTLTVNMSGMATKSSILPQVISGFSPPASLEVGQQFTLSATGGLSGNPVVFSIDPTSPCTSCATVSGTNGSTLTAVSAGTVIVDANQAGGANNGSQYAAAKQVQATVTINYTVVPPNVPALLMSQQNWLAALPAGGAFAQDSGAGSSMGVNPQGNVLVSTSYGGTVALYNVQAGAWTTLGKYGKYGNTGGVAVDSAGNLYMGALYSNIIAMVPYNNGKYSAVTDASSGTPPANCTSSSTSECVIAPVAATSGIGGVSAMTFDSAGDLFIGTDDQGGNPWSIWECTAACLSTGSPAPIMIYQEPAGNNGSTTVGQYYTGGLAVDPWGNLFFTDSLLLNQSANANKSISSDLQYLPISTGAGYGGVTTGYAAAPTLLQTFTNAKPGGYDDQLASVAVATNGTVYYSVDQNDGVYAIPNTQTGGPVIADQYAVSSQGAEIMTLDSHGSIFYIAYSGSLGGHSLGDIFTANDLQTPNAQYQGTAVTAPATVVDNAFTCSTAATLAITSSNPEFSATAGAKCSQLAFPTYDGTLLNPVATVSSYPATITFNPTQPNAQSATLALSDTTNGGVGTAMVNGYAETTPQTLTFTAPTATTYTYAPGETVTVSVTNGGSNNPATFTVDSSSSGAGTFSATTVTGTTSTAVLTITQAGSIVIDANELGGLVSGTYYSVAPQVQLTLTVNQAAQAIVFPQPNSPVTFSTNPSTTVQLSANGGPSGNPVTFTVDNTSTGAGTISDSTVSNGTSTATLTVTGAGNIVIDANQAANIDYSAATQVQETVVVNQAAQTITFTPLSQPFHYIVTGVALTLQATGGGSDSALVFTVDKSSTMTGGFSTSTVSGAVSTSTLTMPANQSPTSGTIVVDANQPGNTNYAAATQTQFTINVLAPLPTQAITFSPPQTQVAGTTLTLSATASSGFPVSYMSSTTSVCTVSGSTVTFAAVTSASACTITATQVGDNQYFAAAVPVTVTFAVNPAGMTPSMSLDLSLSSLTINPGTVGLAQITVNSVNNFTATQVTFACSGLPSGYTCTFNPTTITAFVPSSTTGLPSGSSATTTLSIAPPATAALVRHDLRPLFPVTFAVALCFMGFRKRNRLQLLLLLVVVLAGLGMISGCGGSSSKSTQQPVTSTATITASGGGLQATSTLSVTVE